MQSVYIADNKHALAFSFDNFVSFGADRTRSDSESTIGMEETAASDNAENRVGVQPLLRDREHQQRSLVVGKDFATIIVIFAAEENVLTADATIEQGGPHRIGQPHITTS